MKLKAEANGYPHWVRKPEDKERYIDSFYASEGMRLDREAIRPNAAKRGLAKLCLNSMWGKLMERNDRTKTKIRILATPGIEVVSLMFASDVVVWASWSFIEEEEIPNLRHTNEVIGDYVTAAARLHFYSFLDSLQERAIHCNIESVLFVRPRDEQALVETGDSPGAKASELKYSEFIEEFDGGGPKNKS